MAGPHNETWNEEKEQRWITFVQSINSEISPQAVRLIGEMRKAAYAMHHIGQASIAPSGLSHAQYMVLMSLYVGEQVDGRAELNPSEISERLGNSRNSTSSLIRGLEKDGLITRQLDENDRRKFKIRLADDGRDLVSTYSHKHISIVGGSFNQLTEAEQATLGQLLAKLTLKIEEARDRMEQETR